MCNCLADINKKLIEHNATLEYLNVVNKTSGKQRDAGPLLRVKWLGPIKGKELPIVFCVFCPLCGEKLPESAK